MYTLLRIFVYRSPPGHERGTSWLIMSKSKRCHVLLPDLLCSMTKESPFDIALVHLFDSTQYPCLLVRPDDATVRAIHKELVRLLGLVPCSLLT